MAERKLPKLETGVRFPSPALTALPSRRLAIRPQRYRRRRRAEILQRALAASRRRRLADLASQPDERHVQRRAEPVGHQLVQEPVGALGARPSAGPARAASSPGARACRPASRHGRARSSGPPPRSSGRCRAATSGSRAPRRPPWRAAARGRTRPRVRAPRAGSPGCAAPSSWRARRCGSRRRRAPEGASTTAVPAPGKASRELAERALGVQVARVLATAR